MFNWLQNSQKKTYLLISGLFFISMVIFGSIFFFKIPRIKFRSYEKVGQYFLATTPQQQQLGLSYSLPLSCSGEICDGMLFVFSSERDNKFWMKGMYYDLWISWYDKTGKLIETKLVTKESYPNSFGPEKLSQYVLELPYKKDKTIFIPNDISPILHEFRNTDSGYY
jgi:uncharacterized membrane protein (UPF0127 family)